MRREICIEWKSEIFNKIADEMRINDEVERISIRSGYINIQRYMKIIIEPAVVREYGECSYGPVIEIEEEEEEGFIRYRCGLVSNVSHIIVGIISIGSEFYRSGRYMTEMDICKYLNVIRPDVIDNTKPQNNSKIQK